VQGKDSSGNAKYMSGVHCVQVVLREEGVRGLFRGLSVNLFRNMGGALLLVGYDEAKAVIFNR
jgi:hypothetical protein